jgi:sodium pump decarboxylase gamma subunit
MFMNLSNVLLSGMTIQEKLSWGGNGLVMGFGSVFVILVILIAVINLLKLGTRGKKNKKAAVTPVAVKPVVKEVEEDESEIIAVIAAAVNCMAQREGKRFAIKSFKRIGSRAKRSY